MMSPASFDGRQWITLVWLFFASSAANADTQHLFGLGNTHYELIESSVIGRSFHTYTMLPSGYDDADEAPVLYPTLYVLDGGALFPLLASYYRYLNFAGESPDLIIVGISYGSDTLEGGNYRSTDYTAKSDEREYWGGAEDFQRFLSDELMPRIEDQYRSRPDRRLIFGQSIGGQFVLFTALTRPDLFWGHIASNPALHRNLPFFLQSQSETSTSDSRVFVASATGDDPRFREPAEKWIQHWTTLTEKPWALKTSDLDGHSHMSAPPTSFRDGIRWLFSIDQ